MVERYKSNLKDLDRFLGCYPYDIWKQWKELTNHITPPLVERCSPICGYVNKFYKLLIVFTIFILLLTNFCISAL